MILTISGKAGSGKSTIAKDLAKKLKIRHYSIGDLMRQLAQEKKVSLLELSKLAEEDESIDRELDQKQIELRKQDNFVIDGRLTAFFIPNATLKVFLDCDNIIRAKRIIKEKRHDEQHETVQQALKRIKMREDSERKRYKQYYDVDYYDPRLYDMVIDTSNLRVDQVLGKIMDRIKKG